MVKNKIFLLIILVTFCSLNLYLFYLFGFSFDIVSVTGNALSSGTLSIFVEGLERFIYVYSPLEGEDYHFDIGENYSINLETSASFEVEEWKYSLYDLRHDILVYDQVSFLPNISSFNAVRWDNLLTVFAKERDSSWYNKTINFHVIIPNSAPIINLPEEELYVCEGKRLYHYFNATDLDEQSLSARISPTYNLFYVLESEGVFNYTTRFFRLLSPTNPVINKNHLGGVHVGSRTYEVNVSVSDGTYSDSKNLDITLIEINNIPFLEGIGAKTIYLQGEESNFYHQVKVADIEDGVPEEGNFEFNLSFEGNESLFDISELGVMNFTPSSEEQVGTYNLTYCVKDRPLMSSHPNISLCLPQDNNSKSVCDDFSLTITDENRPPQILNYTPENQKISVKGTESFLLSVEVYDPDGTIPDVDWYVGNELLKHDERETNSSFDYAFGCDVGGTYNISVKVTDGLEFVLHTWVIEVSLVGCPTPSSGGGGGGFFMPLQCNEEWVCEDWGVCQNVKRSFNANILSPEEYGFLNELCAQEGFEDERFCGFQITSCKDLNGCDNPYFINEKPLEVQVCYFTEDPSCFDGIKNCHSEGCEVLVDCGGPCKPCPTCSDEIRNQGEEGIDCGGPCPWPCEKETPLGVISYALITLFLLLTILVFYSIYKFFILLGYKKRKKEEGENL